jgi:hypothetical protein
VAGHVDGAAEAAAVEQVRELVALGGAQERGGDGVALVVELLAQRVPVQGVDSVSDRHTSGTAGGRLA